MKAVSIANWDRLYENNRSRSIKALDWVPVPNKHDGEGYAMVMAHPKAAEIYTAFHLMLQVASRCHPRGTLVRPDGRALTAETLALKTRTKPAWFTLAIEVLSDPEIGWITVKEVADPHSGAMTAHPDAMTTQSTDALAPLEGKGREEKGIEGREPHGTDVPAPGQVSDEEWLNQLQSQEVYRGVNVQAEYAKMKNWCATTGRKPSHRRFINWLNRCEKSINATHISTNRAGSNRNAGTANEGRSSDYAGL
jgi:hypothetical protein